MPGVKRAADGLVETGILQISTQLGRRGISRYCLTNDEVEAQP
jgi:hypothetical protein